MDKVRVIFEGKQLGIFLLSEAGLIAEEKNLDLIEMAPGVYKIMDYSKYQYKKGKVKTAKKVKLKTVKISFNIGKHDLETKIKMGSRFLEQGHMLKIILTLKGRQNPEMGRELLDAVIEKLPEGKLQDPVRFENNNFSVVLVKK